MGMIVLSCPCYLTISHPHLYGHGNVQFWKQYVNEINYTWSKSSSYGEKNKDVYSFSYIIKTQLPSCFQWSIIIICKGLTIMFFDI
jgi:hypothetical protein